MLKHRPKAIDMDLVHITQMTHVLSHTEACSFRPHCPRVLGKTFNCCGHSSRKIRKQNHHGIEVTSNWKRAKYCAVREDTIHPSTCLNNLVPACAHDVSHHRPAELPSGYVGDSLWKLLGNLIANSHDRRDTSACQRCELGIACRRAEKRLELLAERCGAEVIKTRMHQLLRVTARSETLLLRRFVVKYFEALAGSTVVQPVAPIERGRGNEGWGSESRCKSGAVDRADECLCRRPRRLGNVFVRPSAAKGSGAGAGRKASATATPTIETTNCGRDVPGRSAIRGTGGTTVASIPNRQSVIVSSNVIVIGAGAWSMAHPGYLQMGTPQR